MISFEFAICMGLALYSLYNGMMVINVASAGKLYQSRLILLGETSGNMYKGSRGQGLDITKKEYIRRRKGDRKH